MRDRTAFAAGIVLTLAFFMIPVFAGEPDDAGAEPRRLKIVATLFPQYDFARQIAGDKASVRLLLSPGAESHSFDPTPADMRDIAGADIFVYTGPHMEPWAERLADSAAAPEGVLVVDASDGARLLDSESGDEHVHDGPDAHPENAADVEHNHTVDPHIWLSPVLAVGMAENIGAALAEKDPANADFYREKTAALCDDLERLDADISARIAPLPRRLLVFGERFPFAYFCARYGLSVESPFNSCVAGAEPGLRAVLDTIGVVKKENVKYIYVEAMTASRMAEVIAKETGAGILRVDSLHNPPLEKQQSGATYQSVMRENLDAFAKGLE